jgi:hypothetical protein
MVGSRLGAIIETEHRLHYTGKLFRQQDGADAATKDAGRGFDPPEIDAKGLAHLRRLSRESQGAAAEVAFNDLKAMAPGEGRHRVRVRGRGAVARRKRLAGQMGFGSVPARQLRQTRAEIVRPAQYDADLDVFARGGGTCVARAQRQLTLAASKGK